MAHEAHTERLTERLKIQHTAAEHLDQITWDARTAKWLESASKPIPKPGLKPSIYHIQKNGRVHVTCGYCLQQVDIADTNHILIGFFMRIGEQDVLDENDQPTGETKPRWTVRTRTVLGCLACQDLYLQAICDVKDGYVGFLQENR